MQLHMHILLIIKPNYSILFTRRQSKYDTFKIELLYFTAHQSLLKYTSMQLPTFKMTLTQAVDSIE